jgi:hypothetical protein
VHYQRCVKGSLRIDMHVRSDREINANETNGHVARQLMLESVSVRHAGVEEKDARLNEEV